jgi:integrase
MRKIQALPNNFNILTILTRQSRFPFHAEPKQIKVQVVAYPDRKNLMMRYWYPQTGRQVARSTGTTKRREAERIAAKWEAELQEGRYQSPSKITWEEFRERYEHEVLSARAAQTERKTQGVLNSVEEIPRPVRLRDLTSARLSYYQSRLRSMGRAEDTIAGHLAHLQPALRWACRIGMLLKAPTVEKPPRAKGAESMKGRPITTEEFERLLGKASIVVGDKAAPSWCHYLQGLWLSGLRLGESLELSWDDPSKLQVDLLGNYPMLRIPAELEKGNKDRLLPIVPDFAEFLLSTPGGERTGFVFNPTGRDGTERLGKDRVMHMAGAIGKAANIKVATNSKTGKVKYASAHDLRRSFGFRWAVRVMPPVLKELMRHASIDTTMRFYVGRNAEAMAKLLWAEHRPGTVGNILGNSGPKSGSTDLGGTDASPSGKKV